MPLGNDLSKNISELVHKGKYPVAQAVAIALHHQDEMKRKHMAEGGNVTGRQDTILENMPSQYSYDPDTVGGRQRTPAEEKQDIKEMQSKVKGSKPSVNGHLRGEADSIPANVAMLSEGGDVQGSILTNDDYAESTVRAPKKQAPPTKREMEIIEGNPEIKHGEVIEGEATVKPVKKAYGGGMYADGGEVDNNLPSSYSSQLVSGAIPFATSTSAAAGQGAGRAVLGDTPAKGDEITPTSSPVDLVAGSIPAMIESGPALMGNEIGSVGSSIRSGVNAWAPIEGSPAARIMAQTGADQAASPQAALSTLNEALNKGAIPHQDWSKAAAHLHRVLGYADGGTVGAAPNQPTTVKAPAASPKPSMSPKSDTATESAREIEKGATESKPEGMSYMKNLKEGLGLAEGGYPEDRESDKTAAEEHATPSEEKSTISKLYDEIFGSKGEKKTDDVPTHPSYEMTDPGVLTAVPTAAAPEAPAAPITSPEPSLFDRVSAQYKAKTPDMTASIPPSPPAAATPGAAPSAAVPTPPAAATPTPTAPTSSVNPLIAKYLQDQQDMQSAQEKANTNQLIAGLSRAGGMIAHSAYGNTQPLEEGAFNALEKNANAPVANLQAQQAAGQKSLETQNAIRQSINAQAADDPNSPLSAATRNMYAPLLKKAGIDAAPIATMSASDVKAYAQNPLEFTAKMNETSAQKALQLEMMKERMAMQQGAKQSQAFNQTATALEQMRGNPAVQQAEKDIYAASKADRMMAQAPGGDPNNLSRGQVALLANDIAKINAGGVPTQHELDAITPNSLRGQLAGVASKLLNEPTPANAGAFLKQYQDYAHGVTQDAQKVITDRYGRIISTHAATLTPEQKQELSDNYINRFKTAASPAAASQNAHPHDSVAVDWAKKNPTDPRSAQILQLNGMGQ